MLMIRRLLNRTFEPEPSTQFHDSFEFDSSQYEVDMEGDWTVRNMTIRERIHHTLLQNRQADEESEISSGSPTAVNTSNRRSFLNEEDDDFTDPVNRYLTEQNRKFNELINKNLDYVSHSSLDLSDVYKHNKPQEPEQIPEPKHNLSDYEINKLIETIDDDTKLKVYEKLGNEMNNEDVVKNLNNFEKFEVLVILLVKINFLLIRLSIPITKKVYYKFMANQMVVFNNHNFNRVLNYLIKLLNNVDKNFQKPVENDNELNEQMNDEIDQSNDTGLVNKVMNVIPNKYRVFGLMGGLNYIGNEFITAQTQNQNHSPTNSQKQNNHLTILTIAEEFAKQLQ